jgi:hypothetical protein
MAGGIYNRKKRGYVSGQELYREGGVMATGSGEGEGCVYCHKWWVFSSSGSTAKHK